MLWFLLRPFDPFSTFRAGEFAKCLVTNYFINKKQIKK